MAAFTSASPAPWADGAEHAKWRGSLQFHAKVRPYQPPASFVEEPRSRLPLALSGARLVAWDGALAAVEHLYHGGHSEQSWSREPARWCDGPPMAAERAQ